MNSFSKSQERIAYLECAYKIIRTDLIPLAPEVEKIAFGYSFPSTRATGPGMRLGECHYKGVESGEERFIALSPYIWRNDVELLAVLAHEMLHAWLGPDVGHKKVFLAEANRIGLEGKAKATVPGLAFLDKVVEWRLVLSQFPAGALIGIVKEKKERKASGVFVCNCSPPIKVRASCEDFDATCNACGVLFLRKDKENKDDEGN